MSGDGSRGPDADAARREYNLLTLSISISQNHRKIGSGIVGRYHFKLSGTIVIRVASDNFCGAASNACKLNHRTTNYSTTGISI